MGNAGYRTIRISDSSLSTEIYVGDSSRNEESSWDVLNSTITGSNRVRRDMGTLRFPLPANVTVVDNNLFHSPEAMDMLWILVVINFFMSAIVCMQFLMRGYELAKIYWEGDDRRIAPPASFPHAFGVTGPMTVNMNPRKKVVINDVPDTCCSPATEITTVDESDETTAGDRDAGYAGYKY